MGGRDVCVVQSLCNGAAQFQTDVCAHELSAAATMTLAEKRHPDRFTEMSGKMAAIVAYVLEEAWSEPAITSLSVTADGHVTADHEFLGTAADLDRNLLDLLLAAELTADERAEFERRYRERVDDWRPVLSGPQPTSGRLMRPNYGAVPGRA